MPKQAVIERIYVWDKFIRLHHWLIAILIPVNGWLLTGGDDVHRWTGYLLAALVSARIVWGFIGHGAALFSQFFPTPQRVLHYLCHYRNPHSPLPSGHNPLGASMALLMLSLIFALAITGWLMGTDAYWGEDWLQNLHSNIFNILIICATIHVSMVILHSLHLRINLPRAMLTGYKNRTNASRRLETKAELKR
ncbi:MAG: cytochrome B [Sulfuriferula sp.]|nr:cytochrome B [Sulfuriferula sp.]